MKIPISNFESAFSKLILTRAYEYYKEGHINNLTYNNSLNIIEADIVGSKVYQTKIVIKNNNIIETNCNCPFDGLCKHLGALMYEVRDNLYQTNQSDTFFDDLFDETIYLLNSHHTSNQFRELSNKYKFLKIDSSKYVDESFHQNIYTLFNNLSKVLSTNELELLINSYLTRFYNMGRIDNIITSIASSFEYEKISLIYLLQIYKGHVNFNYLLADKSFNELFVKTFEKTKDLDLIYFITDTYFFDGLRKYILKTQDSKKTLYKIISFFNIPTLRKLEALEEIFEVDEIRPLMDLIDFEVNSLDLSLVLNERYGREMKFDYFKLNRQVITDNFEMLKENYKDEMIDYIEKLLMDSIKPLDNIDLLEILKQIDSEYDYSKNSKVYEFALYNGLVSNDLSYKVYNEGFPIEVKKEKGLSKGMLEVDNEVIYYFNKKEGKIRYILLQNGHLEFRGHVSDDYEEEYNSFKVDFMDEFSLSRQIRDDVDSDYIYYQSDNGNKVFYDQLLLGKSSDLANNKYLKLVEDVRKYNENKNRELLLKDSLKLIDKLSYELFETSSIILDNKVRLQLVISLDNLYKDGYYYKEEPRLNVYETNTLDLTVRMGVNRLYVVRNLQTLLSNIENLTFSKYGKELAFDHNIKSFTKDSASYINVLERNLGRSKIKNLEALEYHHTKLNEMFNLVKGKVVVLNDYKLSNDYLEFFFMEEDYEFEVILNNQEFIIKDMEDLKDKGQVIITPSFDLYLNYVNQTIQFVNYKSLRLRKLVHFILLNDDFKSNLVLTELVEKIVPFVSNDIKLSDDIKAKVKEHKLVIDSYFDYDDLKDNITVRSKYFQNERELKDDEISNHKLMINNYEHTLKSFGFDSSVMSEKDYIINFLNADLTDIKTFGDVFISENISNKKVVKMDKIDVNVSLDGNLLSTIIESNNLTSEEIVKVLEGLRKGKKFVILEDNVIMTNDPNIVDLNTFLELNEINYKEVGRVIEKPIYEVFKLDDSSNINVNIEDRVKEIVKDVLNYKTYDNYIKPSMYNTLKDYQKEGLNWLKVLSKHNLGGILADDMGLGKTLQIISYLESEEFDLSIVVCPKSLIYNWDNEITKFNASFDSLVYVGTPSERLSLLEEKLKSTKGKKLLIITSYDILRFDLDHFKEYYFENIILDEAQAIKTATALRTRAVKELSGNKRFVLTGTPIENSIFDLWSLFDFLMPGYLYSSKKFNKLGLKVHEEDENTLNFLVKKTKPFILRRVKRDVLTELPEKIEQVVYTTFDGENRKVYNAYLGLVQEKLDNPETNRIEILSDLMRLRQLCISPRLVYENYEGDELKIEAAKNLIDEAVNGDHKVLVFSTFVGALDLLKANFNEDEYFVLTGKTSAEDRVKMVEEFNKEDSKQKVFFISLKAGGTGLNLVGADIVIHLDPWWNLAAENQATDRAHRIGQENIVTVYKLVMAGSIEERIIELQNMKKDLFDKMIDNDDLVNKITADDYNYILK